MAGKQAKFHLYLQPLAIDHITALALPPVRSAVALGSHKNANPTVNGTYEGPRLLVRYESHPQAISHPQPHRSMEKMSSTESVFGAKKVGDFWLKL